LVITVDLETLVDRLNSPFIFDGFDEKRDFWNLDDRITTGTPEAWSADFEVGPRLVHQKQGSE
jgi:hypothetical protein